MNVAKPKKLLCGVAFNSGGKYKTWENGKNTKANPIWTAMVRRCYSSEQQIKQPSYIGCSIDENWHDYQNFAEWFYSHKYSDLGYHLDKDLLIPDNRIYSPDRCCFVPRQLNNLTIDRKGDRGDLPQGVTWHKGSGVYHSRISVNGKRKHLGHYDNIEDAYQMYVVGKEKYIKHMAKNWQDRIADDVFQALMNWSLPTFEELQWEI